MFTRFSTIVTGLIVCLLSGTGTLFGDVPGAPLAERVPGDAIIYIGWAGVSKLGPGYERSHTRALLEASDFKALVTQVWPQLLKKIEADDPEAAEQAGKVELLLEQMLKYPTAVYFGGMDMESQMPRLAMICDAGDEAHAAKIESSITELIGGKITWQVHKQGGRVIVNTAAKDFAPEQAAGSPLSASAAFTGALKQIQMQGEPVVAAYVDVQKLVTMADQIMAQGPDGERWPALRDAMRLNELRQVMMSGGFEGGDWVSSAYIGVAQSDAGIARMLRGRALDEATIKLIPQTAAMAGAGWLDLLQLYDQIHDAIGQVEPRGGQQIDEFLTRFNQQMGVNLREDVLGSFGDQWLWYSDRNVGGTGMFGMVVINPMRDAGKLEKAMPKLMSMVNMMMMAATRGKDFRLSVRVTEVEGATLYYFALPLVAPTLAIKDGRLYMGLQPQTVVAAIQTAGANVGGKSILDNAEFARLQRAAGGKPMSSFEFYDLPQTFSGGYQMTLMMARLYVGMGDMFGLQMPAMVMPAANHVMPHVAAAGVFTWTDEAGWHMRGRSPFPGAALVGTEQNLMVSQYAMSLGILLPAMGRARTIANRAVSAANLSGIYKACYIYSTSHNDAFPADLAELIADGSISAKSVLHPEDAHRTRTFPQVRLDDPKVSAWVKANMSYVYLGGSANMSPDDIMAYEKPDASWAREGINIVYGDGHVAWMSWAQVPGEFKRAKKTPPAPPQGSRAGTAGDGGRATGQAWYYDIKADEYFTANADQFPPITSPKGNAAVRAHFFSCGDCDDKGQRFVGFYDKFTDEAKAKLEAARDSATPETLGDMEMYYEKVQYSLDGKTWSAPSDIHYQEQLQKKLQCLNGGRPRYCRAN